jgi:hypothetical protein
MIDPSTKSIRNSISNPQLLFTGAAAINKVINRSHLKHSTRGRPLPLQNHGMNKVEDSHAEMIVPLCAQMLEQRKDHANDCVPKFLQVGKDFDRTLESTSTTFWQLNLP